MKEKMRNAARKNRENVKKEVAMQLQNPGVSKFLKICGKLLFESFYLSGQQKKRKRQVEHIISPQSQHKSICSKEGSKRAA